MPVSDNSGSTLLQYVNDMLALEKGLLEAIARQRADERVKAMADANAVILQIHTMLHEHVATMENHAAALGLGAGRTLKEAVTTAAGAMAGLYDKMRQDPVSRMLRDDYTALSLASVSYGMLHTTGLALRDPVVANVALRHLNDLPRLIIEVNRVIPSVVARELADTAQDIDPSAAAQAVENVQKVWAGQAPSSSDSTATAPLL